MQEMRDQFNEKFKELKAQNKILFDSVKDGNQPPEVVHNADLPIDEASGGTLFATTEASAIQGDY